MTDSCNSNWGTVLGAGLVGYFLGNGGGFFNNNGNNGVCCENAKISAIQTKVNDLAEGQDTKAILDATIAGTGAIRDDLAQINRDNYALNIQGIYNQQTVARSVDNQFCKTQEMVVADGAATRAAVNAFETRYLEDRVRDRDLLIAKLENQLSVAPLACAINSVNYKLDSVIGCAGVRTCGSACSSTSFNPYTVPPLVGTATSTNSYNPSIPTA